MFGPKRKIGEKAIRDIDPPLTQQKYDEYVKNLEHLKKVVRPRMSKEVMILAEGGDFSENAGYQAAKGALRGINSKILDLEQRIKKARIITVNKDTGTVQLGHSVILKINGKQQTYTILGSTESNPGKGIISHNSPIGSAIIGRRVGDTVQVFTNDKKIDCEILRID